MTIIVHQNGVFYSDSRRSGHLGPISERVFKISIPPKFRDIEKYGCWDGEPILAIAGAGLADGIAAITQLLFDDGNAAVDSYRKLRQKGFARALDCTVIILTANYAIMLHCNKTNDAAGVRFSKHKRSELLIAGSGTAAAKMAGSFFRTDSIGLVCAAIAMSPTCGGFVMTYDTNVKDAVMTTRYYRYPRLRVAWGGIRLLCAKVGTYFNLTFPY